MTSVESGWQVYLESFLERRIGCLDGKIVGLRRGKILSSGSLEREKMTRLGGLFVGFLRGPLDRFSETFEFGTGNNT